MRVLKAIKAQNSRPLAHNEISVVKFTLEEIEDLICDGRLERPLQKMVSVARDLERRGIADEYRQEVVILKGTYSEVKRTHMTVAERQATLSDLMSRALMIAKDIEKDCSHGEDRNAAL